MNLISYTVVLVLGVITVSQCRPDGGGSYKQPDGYFMYLNVPGPKEYEAGHNRGNAKHHISRFDQVKDHRFRTRVKWHDEKDGYGEHYFEYNHSPKYHDPHQHKHHDPHHHKHHEPVYHEHPKYDVLHDPHEGLYSKHEPVFIDTEGQQPLRRTTFESGRLDGRMQQE